MHDGDEVTTIEGLGTPENPSPLQRSFHEHDGFQCGYCTPGQICSASAMMDEITNNWPSDASESLTGDIQASDAEIRERMSGNLCRCGAYANILTAIRDAAAGADR
jgi:xanthine dehydrogenase YagT iron-sulfur-binding subunit